MAARGKLDRFTASSIRHYRLFSVISARRGARRGKQQRRLRYTILREFPTRGKKRVIESFLAVTQGGRTLFRFLFDQWLSRVDVDIFEPSERAEK